MKLVEKLSQMRRDFKGKYECENCGYVRVDDGLSSYDDGYFHLNVIPNMKCPECGKSRKDLGDESVQVNLKYPDGKVV